MQNKWIKDTLNGLIGNKKALKVIEEQLNSMSQNEDGDLWITPKQASKIVGIIALAYFNEDKLKEVMEDDYFGESYPSGSIVAGIDHDDGTIFTDPIEGNLYLEVFID